MPRNVSRTEVLIGFLAVLSIFLVVLGNIMLRQGRFPLGVYLVDFVICVVFAVEFLKRSRASEARGQFFKRHWYELPALVPALALDLMIGLPILSAGLRALRLIRFVRVIIAGNLLRRGVDSATRFEQRIHLLYLAVIAGGLVIAASFAVLAIEFRIAASPIKGVADALWWGLATVTTVGYGDIVPATALGRIIGMLLMVVGVGAMAAFVSQVSAALVESRLAKRAGLRNVGVAQLEVLIQTVGRLPQLSDAELGSLLHDIVDAHRQARAEFGRGKLQQ